MEPSTAIVPVKLESGVIFKVEATEYRPVEGDVAGGIPRDFQEVGAVIEEIAAAVLATLKKVRPRKGAVESGLEIGLESGGLTALLVKGTGKANLKITLEWAADPPAAATGS